MSFAIYSLTSIHKFDRIEDMMTGEIPNHLVQAIFELVKNNENLREHIGPHLNLSTDKYPIDSEASKRVHHPKCYVLSDELQKYYNEIRQFNSMKNYVEVDSVDGVLHKEQDEDNNRQRKRKRVVRSCSKGLVHERFVIVERLLKQFDRLSLSNQKRAFESRTSLVQHLHMLDELRRFANASERGGSGRSRTVRSSVSNGKDQGKELNQRSGTLSERYSKLVQAAEFIRKNSFFDQTEEFNNYDDYLAFNEYGYD